MRAAIVVVGVWMACGVLGAGMLNAKLRHDFRTLDSCIQRREDVVFSLMLGVLGGPMSLFLMSAITGIGAAGWSLAIEPCRSEK